jgi:hypothetical protein
MFLALFVKWVLQTNKKNMFEEPAVSALRNLGIQVFSYFSQNFHPNRRNFL